MTASRVITDMTTGQVIMWILTILLGFVILVFFLSTLDKNEQSSLLGAILFMFFGYLFIKIRRIDAELAELRHQVQQLTQKQD